MSKLRVGVIGAGFMGRMHASIYKQLPNAELVGITDQNRARSDLVAAKLGVRSFASIEDLLGFSHLEAVSICTSDENHLCPSIICAEAGKHILLEKPIATSIEEAEAIVEAARKNQVRLAVGHLLRFDPKYLKLKEYVESGHLGRVVSIYTRRNSPITDGPARYGSAGNLTLHVAIHDADLILWIMQKKAIRVYAESASIALVNMEIDDAVFATVKFEDGTIACMQYNWVLPARFPTHIDAKMEVVGTQGSAGVDCANQGVWTCGEDGFQLPDIAHWPAFDGRVTGDLREELGAFVDALLRDRDFAISTGDALDSLRLALAIAESLREQRIVRC